MPLIPQDMTNVQKWGEQVPAPAWYHVRVKSSTVGDSKETPGAQTVHLIMICQEEPFIGKAINDFPSLQAHALAKLKAYYLAVDYNPGPEGHDPSILVDKEFFVHVSEEVYKGEKRVKVDPWGIRSMREGKPAA